MVVHHDLVSAHHAYQMVMIAQYGDGSKAKLSSGARIVNVRKFVAEEEQTIQIGSVRMG